MVQNFFPSFFLLDEVVTNYFSHSPSLWSRCLHWSRNIRSVWSKCCSSNCFCIHICYLLVGVIWWSRFCLLCSQIVLGWWTGFCLHWVKVWHQWSKESIKNFNSCNNCGWTYFLYFLFVTYCSLSPPSLLKDSFSFFNEFTCSTKEAFSSLNNLTSCCNSWNSFQGTFLDLNKQESK